MRRGHQRVTLLHSSSRCPDQGERLSKAGERAPRPLQHHFLRHSGRDPAFPPHADTGLPLPDAAPPPSADQLLPEDHHQTAGDASEVWRWPVGGRAGVRQEGMKLMKKSETLACSEWSVLGCLDDWWSYQESGILLTPCPVGQQRCWKQLLSVPVSPVPRGKVISSHLPEHSGSTEDLIFQMTQSQYFNRGKNGSSSVLPWMTRSVFLWPTSFQETHWWCHIFAILRLKCWFKSNSWFVFTSVWSQIIYCIIVILLVALILLLWLVTFNSAHIVILVTWQPKMITLPEFSCPSELTLYISRNVETEINILLQNYEQISS